MATWYHRDVYNENMEKDDLVDSAPTFKIGDKIITRHSCPGNEGVVAAVLDPRIYCNFVGLNRYDTQLNAWAAYVGCSKTEAALNYIYSIKFSQPTLVLRLDSGVPKEVKAQHTAWNAILIESDIELSSRYWDRMEKGLNHEK
ncbi:hypothetical protein KAR91_50250 [Candidatus Pacearchaeota archaeon]|nr:hypothetical protein [Candidatus Pacearchaeota archaeon]